MTDEELRRIFAKNLNGLLSATGVKQYELSERLGVSESTVSSWCSGAKMPRMSKIDQMAIMFGVSRSDLLEEKLDAQSGIIRIRFNHKPLVGDIACGTPILAEENITDYVDVPEHINCDFALRCRGRSMINLGVKEGDIVYIRSQPEVQNGQIAAVIVDGMEAEATLKKFYRYDNQIVLVPANDEDKPFVYIGEEMARVHVQGLAVGFTHMFEQ